MTTHTQPAGSDLDSLEGAELLYTSRGFALLNFKDHYGVECSIQKSSLATEDAIWFGPSDAEPKIMAVQAAAHGIDPGDGTGWVPFPIPCGVSLTTRAHLTRDQVAALLPVFQHFADTGDVAAARAAQAPQGDTRQGAPEPAAAQFKMPGETWEECSIDEEESMRANGYKFRYLYAVPPAAHTCTPADERAQIEAMAKAIYLRFDGANEHPWVERGNSDMQEEARLYARAAYRAAQGAGTAPVDACADIILATWPARIWLQSGEVDERESYHAARRQGDGITWCEDNINKFDVEYVRADLATHPAPVSTAATPDDPRITAFYKLRDIAERDEDIESANIIQAAISELHWSRVDAQAATVSTAAATTASSKGGNNA